MIDQKNTHSYTHNDYAINLSHVFQLAQQMDEGHQKQVEELNQELMEVKVSSKILPQSIDLGFHHLTRHARFMNSQ